MCLEIKLPHESLVVMIVSKVCKIALQRHNTETSKQIFPEKEFAAASVPISTLMCLWAIYIFPLTICLFCCREICMWAILEINKSLTNTWMWKLGLRPRNSFFWEYIKGVFSLQWAFNFEWFSSQRFDSCWDISALFPPWNMIFERYKIYQLSK